MEASEFVKLARLVTENHPKTRKGPGFVGSYHKESRLLFQDKKVKVEISTVDDATIISQTGSPVPVTIVHPNGNIAYHSLDHDVLIEHLQRLLEEVFSSL